VNTGYPVASGTVSLPVCAVWTLNQAFMGAKGVAGKMEMDFLSLNMQQP